MNFLESDFGPDYAMSDSSNDESPKKKNNKIIGKEVSF